MPSETNEPSQVPQWRVRYWNGEGMGGCPERILRLLEAEERAAMVTVTEKGTEAGVTARRYLADRLEGPVRPSLEVVHSEAAALDLSRLSIAQREQLLMLTELARPEGSGAPLALPAPRFSSGSFPYGRSPLHDSYDDDPDADADPG